MGFFKDIQKLQWADLDPNNKNGQLAENLRDLDKQVLQPIVKDDLVSAFIEIPFAAPIAIAYFTTLYAAAPRHNPLPLWLKIALTDLDVYPGLDLSKVSYHENCEVVAGGLTIGYNIFFRGVMHLARPNVDKNDLALMLHEIQHTLQYQRGGGLGPVFTKVILQYGGEALAQLGRLTSGANIPSIHDDAPLEAEADRVSLENFDRVWLEMLSYKDIPDVQEQSRGDTRPRGGIIP